MLTRVTDLSTLRSRPVRFVDGVVHPDDLSEATRLVLGCEQSVIGRHDSSADDVGRMFVVSSMDRESSCFLLDEGEVVGLLWVEKDPYEQVTGVDTYALPWPQARDVRAEALRLGLAAARRHRAASGSPTWKARSGGYVEDTAYADVMTDAGMVPVRRFYRMSIDSDSPLVPAGMPELPDGVEIVVPLDDETRRVVHAVDRAAFAEHWGFADYPYDDWWEHMSASDSFDPSDWWLLTVDGTPAAICLLGEGRAAMNEGYVQVLGVLQEFRGRGLAQLLLRRAFVHYRERGRVATLLGVDATNTTGAVALYERVGMSSVLVMEAFEHDLA